MRNRRGFFLAAWLTAFVAMFGVLCVAEASDAYRLERVVVLSRHNVRAPLTGTDSFLSRMTPHTWFAWTAKPGDLSPLGGELETLMGQYFRTWLTDEGLIDDNEEPEPGEVRFLANSYQRTIATAQYFSSGMLPIANVRVERRFKLNEADPIFLPSLILNDVFCARVLAELDAVGGAKAFGEAMTRESELTASVLDFAESEAAKEESISSVRTDDLTFAFTETGFRISGSQRSLMKAADALSLQYYEELDPVQAAFGHLLTREDWTGIARLKDMGIRMVHSSPSLSAQLARPLLAIMREEMGTEGRKFVFLCGHDTNLSTVTAALGVEIPPLPESIEQITPIGAKLVFEKRIGDDGQAYAALKYVYQSTDQIRERRTLTREAPPMIVPLRFAGLETNEDGMYRFDDVMERMESVIFG